MAATLYYSIVSVFFVLAVMILVHELGHFVAAKLFGVRVEVFSIGFGKRLVGFRRGDTDYRISVLPFGGYVKMSGENPLDQRTGSAGGVHVPPALAACGHRAGRAVHEHRAGGRPADRAFTWCTTSTRFTWTRPRWWAGSAPAVPLKKREFSPATRSSRSARPGIPIGSTSFPRS